MAAFKCSLSLDSSYCSIARGFWKRWYAGVSTFITVSSYFKIDYFVRNSSFNVTCQLSLT